MRAFLYVVAVMFSVDRFVITEKLPAKPQPHHESIPDDAGNPVPLFAPEPDRFTGPIEWDLDQLATVQAVEPSATVIGYAPAWCQFCPMAKENLGDGDSVVLIEWREEESPLAKTMFSDGRECGYPCLHYVQGDKILRGMSVTSVEHLKQSLGIRSLPQAHVSAISAGAIDRAFIEQLLAIFSPLESGVSCGNDHDIVIGSSVTFTIPARMRVTGKTNGKTTTFTANPKPRISWGRIVSQSIDGLTYDGQRITLNLPWCPDLSLECRAVCESLGVTASVPRSPKWPTVRKHFLEKHSACEACGIKTGWLEVHHIEPFHTNPDKELDESNLITLCRDHHFHIGHDPDYTGPEKPDWKKSNPNVRQDAIKERIKLNTVR